MRIAISPDENPGDSGSVAADGTTERSVNLRVAGALQVVLQRCLQDVWFDPTITYEQRVARANGDGTELLVACAHNESTPGDSGTLFVFCAGGQAFGKQTAAADAVYAELATIPGWPARLPDAVEPVYECCAFNGDTVYAELLFMSPEDERIWSQPSYPQDVAEAMAQGLARTYGFAYVPPGQPAPAPGPEPVNPSPFWWGPYVTGADQVVELNGPCHAPVWWETGGTWYRDTTAVQPAVLGEYAQWVLANRIGGVWYVMDESGGPQGMGPVGRVAPADSWWIEDAVTDSTGCGGNNPPAVALAGHGRWYSITVAEPPPAHLVSSVIDFELPQSRVPKAIHSIRVKDASVPPAKPHLDAAEAALRRTALNLASATNALATASATVAEAQRTVQQVLSEVAAALVIEGER